MDSVERTITRKAMAFDLLILLEKKEQKTFTLPEIETILHAYLNEAEN